MSDIIKFKCPGCGTAYNAKAASAGTTVACTKCREFIDIPKPPPPVAPRVEAEQPRKRNWNPEIAPRGFLDGLVDAIVILFFLAMFGGGCVGAQIASASRATAYGSDTLNIGLLNERQNQVIIFCAISISGAIFLAARYIGSKLEQR